LTLSQSVIFGYLLKYPFGGEWWIVSVDGYGGGGGGSCVMDAFQDDVNFFNPKNVIYA
jgi:hypothetical protein